MGRPIRVNTSIPLEKGPSQVETPDSPNCASSARGSWVLHFIWLALSAHRFSRRFLDVYINGDDLGARRLQFSTRRRSIKRVSPRTNGHEHPVNHDDGWFFLGNTKPRFFEHGHTLTSKRRRWWSGWPAFRLGSGGSTHHVGSCTYGGLSLFFIARLCTFIGALQFGNPHLDVFDLDCLRRVVQNAVGGPGSGRRRHGRIQHDLAQSGNCWTREMVQPRNRLPEGRALCRKIRDLEFGFLLPSQKRGHTYADGVGGFLVCSTGEKRHNRLFFFSPKFCAMALHVMPPMPSVFSSELLPWLPFHRPVPFRQNLLASVGDQSNPCHDRGNRGKRRVKNDEIDCRSNQRGQCDWL